MSPKLGYCAKTITLPILGTVLYPTVLRKLDNVYF